jgi:hypothetical protein
METWNALDWVAGIVGCLPESMASKREPTSDGMIVLYSGADGTYLGRLVERLAQGGVPDAEVRSCLVYPDPQRGG